VVEGTVQNFHAMPYTGHDEDQFTVEDVYFPYSDYVINAGVQQDTLSRRPGACRSACEDPLQWPADPGDDREAGKSGAME
jgi:hypothetical protein